MRSASVKIKRQVYQRDSSGSHGGECKNGSSGMMDSVFFFC